MNVMLIAEALRLLADESYLIQCRLDALEEMAGGCGAEGMLLRQLETICARKQALLELLLTTESAQPNEADDGAAMPAGRRGGGAGRRTHL